VCDWLIAYYALSYFEIIFDSPIHLKSILFILVQKAFWLKWKDVKMLRPDRDIIEGLLESSFSWSLEMIYQTNLKSTLVTLRT
jgi:hypothetical protein